MKQHQKKDFTVTKWLGDNDGEKIIFHAESGMGKTTLASTAPNPVFVGLDDGGRKLKNPVTGEHLAHIAGVDTWQDLKDVLETPSVFAEYDTIVIDTITLAEELCAEWVCANIKGAKGRKCDNLIDYGYNGGFRHLYDTMISILPLLDVYVRDGKNVILISQSTNHKVANASGEDFVREGPRLYPGNASTPSVEAAFCEWADHIFRIGYLEATVEDRKVSGVTTRAVYTQPEVYFRAKSRTLPTDVKVVAFDSPEDDSIWHLLFNSGE
jgi:hypothetical protein